MKRSDRQLWARWAAFAADVARPRLERPLATFAAALALLIQAFIVQPHVHGVAGAHGVLAFQNAGAASSSADQSVALPTHDDDCLVCQTLASSGASIVPVAAIVLATHGAFPTEAGEAPRLLHAAPTLPWQSRAPPIAL